MVVVLKVVVVWVEVVMCSGGEKTGKRRITRRQAKLVDKKGRT